MFEYYNIRDLLQVSKLPLFLVIDGIEDPHNFGAILRTAECAGVDGIIIRKARQVQVNETVIRISTGAANLVKIARVPNIAEAVSFLKNEGIKIIGLDNTALKDYTKEDYKIPVGLVIGGEGKGISHLVKQRCDGLVKIPMKGEITSLNTSVACGIAVYEVLRQRAS